ncbi:MAG TPA: carboxypeptidase regulatory-like domain-containing protein [Candidatus Fimivivens sp.]|nr:carboxypeptidase regulatory-like domain-containing protein [Candidatus Fimivivens sp.]
MMERTGNRTRFGKTGGFTLIEAAFVVFLFSVIALSFYQLFSLGTKRILDVRRKLGAVALASEEMETVRSLPYASIGTKRSDGSGGWDYGIPAGDIVETRTISRSNATYTVHTMAEYKDDSFDGTASGSPNDAIPTDYKRVRIEVSWAGSENDQSVVTWGSFSPNGVEQPSNTGVLSINVTDPSGAELQDADIRVVSAADNVDLTAQTDSTGNLSLPGAPPGNDYMITVSKNGYYGARTYPAYPSSAFNPIDLPMSVVVGSVNQKSFAIGRVSDVTIQSVDTFGEAIPNVPFAVSGGRQIGTTVDPPITAVYDFSDSSQTGSDGKKVYGSRSYGQYVFSSIGSVSGYRFLYVDPEVIGVPDAFDISSSGEDQTASLVFAKTSVPSVLFTVTKTVGATTEAVSGASVRLYDDAIDYDETVTTDLSGKAYFPTSTPGLEDGTYQFEVTTSGYATETGSIDVTGGGLQDRAVTLTAE